MKPYLALLPGLVASCSIFAGVTRLDEMDQAELAAYSARAAALLGSVADVALEEGDVTPEALAALADALEALASGSATVAGYSLLQSLELDGYGAIALTVALTEIDAQLEARGAYDGGLLSDNGKAVVRALAGALRRSE